MFVEIEPVSETDVAMIKVNLHANPHPTILIILFSGCLFLVLLNTLRQFGYNCTLNRQTISLESKLFNRCPHFFNARWQPLGADAQKDCWSQPLSFLVLSVR